MHELRNSVQALTLAIQGILAVTPTGSVRKLASVISQETERLTRVLQTFDSAQFDGETDATAVSIEELIRRMRLVLSARRIPEHVTIKEQLAPRLPRMRGNPEHLGHAVSNLVINVIECLGDRRGTVTISADASDGGIRLMVEDDGPGIPRDRVEHIFEPLTTARHNLGISLSVARTLVEGVGGKLWAEPRPDDAGARFVAWLPLAVD